MGRTVQKEQGEIATYVVDKHVGGICGWRATSVKGLDEVVEDVSGTRRRGLQQRLLSLEKIQEGSSTLVAGSGEKPKARLSRLDRLSQWWKRDEYGGMVARLSFTYLITLHILVGFRCLTNNKIFKQLAKGSYNYLGFVFEVI